jgi:hypothetical protein
MIKTDHKCCESYFTYLRLREEPQMMVAVRICATCGYGSQARKRVDILKCLPRDVWTFIPKERDAYLNALCDLVGEGVLYLWTGKRWEQVAIPASSHWYVVCHDVIVPHSLWMKHRYNRAWRAYLGRLASEKQIESANPTWGLPRINL